MSAQRRTNVKDKSPAPAAASPSTPAARTKEKAVSERGKAIAETRQSVFAARLQPIRTMFRDSLAEMKKVNWPDQQTTRNLTIVVIGISTFLGILLGGIDFVLEKLFQVMT